MFMNRLSILVAFALLGIGAGSFAQPVSAHPSIDIAAANWKFTPDTITLHVGETTQLRLTSTEGVHGLKSDDLGIPSTMITPGKFVTVAVTPKKAGTYLLHCAIMCGAGHEKMVLTVVVDSK
jgi:cytochrome c oxidase subunit 2